MNTIVYLIVMFNASNWGAAGIYWSEFQSMADCSKSLSEMRIENLKPNSGVAAVAYCSPTKAASR